MSESLASGWLRACKEEGGGKCREGGEGGAGEGEGGVGEGGKCRGGRERSEEEKQEYIQ